MTDLRTAALAQQQAEQTWVCPEAPEERTYQKPGHCENCGKTLVLAQPNPPGCDHCRHPLYAATRCRVCGRVTEQAEPVEPVAKVIATAPKRIWLDLGFDPADEDITFDQLFEATWSQDNATGWGIEYVRADLVAPPQRKPLTEEQAMLEMWQDVPGAVNFGITPKAKPPCTDCHGIGYDASGQTCWCQENPSF